jgi:hypothetical protein
MCCAPGRGSIIELLFFLIPSKRRIYALVFSGCTIIGGLIVNKRCMIVKDEAIKCARKEIYRFWIEYLNSVH